MKGSSVLHERGYWGGRLLLIWGDLIKTSGGLPMGDVGGDVESARC